MRQARVDCPSCGEILVAARDVTVSRLCYSFECPGCGTAVSHPATRRETQLLAAQGARIVTGATSQPPPLTMDDMITLHELLQQEDWMQCLLSAPSRPEAATTVAPSPRPPAG
jgi:hypothetical protein